MAESEARALTVAGKPYPKAPADLAVLFDLNGTMIDDDGHTFEAWRQTFALAGRTLTRDEFNRNLAGLGAADILAYLLGDDAPEETARWYAAEKYRLYAELIRAGAVEVSGLTSLLEQLASARVPLAVVTAARPATVTLVLDSLRLRHRFQAVVDGSQVSRRKPAPDPYLQAASLLGIPPERCIVFEDTPAGISGARAAGMTCIGIATSISPQHLVAAGASFASFDFVGLTKDRLQSIVRSEANLRSGSDD